MCKTSMTTCVPAKAIFPKKGQEQVSIVISNLSRQRQKRKAEKRKHVLRKVPVGNRTRKKLFIRGVQNYGEKHSRHFDTAYEVGK